MDGSARGMCASLVNLQKNIPFCWKKDIMTTSHTKTN